MLYDMHFHGGKLSSLGEGKLDLIVKGTPAGDPVEVYLDGPHDMMTERHSAVAAYLKKSGLSENDIVVADGINPNVTTPTAYNLGGLYKQDGGSYNGQAQVDTSSGTGLAGASSGH